MRGDVRERLLALEAAMPAGDRLANDPVRFVHRYSAPADQEVAGLLAAMLAYGKVSLFSPVVDALLTRADACGGPRAWVESFDPAEERRALMGLYYRFHRTEDFVTYAAGLQRFLGDHGAFGSLVRVEEEDVGPALSRAVQALRQAVQKAVGAADYSALSRGVRYSLVDPSSGSASKRLLMFARWMVRSDEVDVGIWHHVSPAALVMPVDTHVHRISRMVGLTARKTADWRTALEVTAALRQLDPHDPVRFDFALAHLGISQGCTGERQAVCENCALRPVCTTWTQRGR